MEIRIEETLDLLIARAVTKQNIIFKISKAVNPLSASVALI